MAADSDNSDSGVGSGDEITIHISCSNGTIQKCYLSNSDVSAEQQRLDFTRGRILKDRQTLESYGSKITLFTWFRGLPASSANTAGSANLGGSNATSGPISGGRHCYQGSDVNGLGGSGVLGMLGTEAEFEQVQQQLTQNPNMMREILNMPVMQSLMDNPDLMPLYAQTLEAARNPELMREMMRNTDRALTCLRRMYETVQEPLMNATTMAGDAENNSGSNLFASLLETKGELKTGIKSINPSTTGFSAAPNTNAPTHGWHTNKHRHRLNSTGDARAPSAAGLGGLGLPEMEQMLGGTEDFSQMNHMVDSNPQIRDDANPELLANCFFPAHSTTAVNLAGAGGGCLEEDLPLQQRVDRLLGQHSSHFFTYLLYRVQKGSGLTGEAAGTPNNMGLDLLMNMFGGLGASGLNVLAQQMFFCLFWSVPEELYATQLSQLQEMGFFDTQENIRALRATSGNVNAAVERLLGGGNPGQ
ncbi:hypothetical protein MKW92_035064 [Papaver armeniacum]|nr:hypothetical protein MKW92_035064 [Papaver armeniacum]